MKILSSITGFSGALLGLALATPQMISPAQAAPPPLKPHQLSLNGTWSLTAGGNTTQTQVPEYGVSTLNVANRLYQRSFQVPSEWANRRIQLEFEMVNFAADVWLEEGPNRRRIEVGSHEGGWVPFEFDLTGKVTPGQQYQLFVQVEGMNGPRTRRADWFENHPIGNQQFVAWFDGIEDNVWLRAYGDPVRVVDSFISPTFENGGALRVTHTLHNASNTAQTFELASVATPWSGNAEADVPTVEFAAQSVTLGPGEQKKVMASYPWSDARQWWPDDPFLYVLITQLRRDGQTLDEETRRFGFREFLIAGNAFTLNGVTTRLRGDYLGFPGNYYMDEVRLSPEALPETYRYLKSRYNFNAIRWHQRAAPGYCFDIADEVGLLLVCESSVYGRPSHNAQGQQMGPMPPAVKANYLANSKTHIDKWTRARRNHASVVMWIPVNEMGPKYLNHQRLTFAEIEELLDVTRQLAGDRPIASHGNNFWLTPDIIARSAASWNDWPTPGHRWSPGLQQSGDEEIVSYHYPGNVPTNDSPRNANGKPWIYTWDFLVNATPKPVQFGEYFQTAGYDRPSHANYNQAIWITRWFGMWNRGLRYLGTADYRPKLVYWTERIQGEPWRISNIALTNSAIALFDRDYDEEGIRYWTSGFRLSHPAGVEQTRRLWLFNDDFRGEELTLEAQMVVNGRVVSTATKTVTQPLGTNGLQTLRVVAPNGPFAIRRRVLKNGAPVFDDTMEYASTPTPAGQRALAPAVAW